MLIFKKLFYYVCLIIATCVIFLLLPLKWVAKKVNSKQFYSLWTGTPIINMAINAKAEKNLKINSQSLVYSTYYITSNFDYNLSTWYSSPIIGKFLPFAVFVWACLIVDRLHFYCDKGLLPSPQIFTFNLFELYIYKLIGIEVYLWTYGADVRSQKATQNLGEPNCCTECNLVGKACICDEIQRLNYIEKLKQYSTAIFSMGDMIEYTLGSRNDLFFWPVDLYGSNSEKYKPIYPQLNTTKPLRIVHAPNHRIFKGTHFLMEAVENLQANGVSIELTLVEKVPNEQALEIYRTADIIFDQCLIGFHGYFALEGMAMGKPVMCFIRKPQEYLLHPDECPLINTHINTLEKDLLQLVSHREQLRAIGIQSRQYIEKYFTLEAFAQRLQKAYQDLGLAR